jgi:hypothetical protein
MAITIGRVDCILIDETSDETSDYCFFQIREDETGEFAIFVIWFGQSDPSRPTQIRQRLWLSMVREALASGRQLVIGHSDSGSAVQSIRAQNSFSTFIS